MTKIFNKLTKNNDKEKILICEISGNHNNSFSHFKKFIHEIIKQKVDLVKFQIYTPDSLTIDSSKKDFLISGGEWSKQKTLYNLFKKSYTPWDWVKKIIHLLNKKNIAWFASVFDKKSVDFLEKLNCKAYKIASPEITDLELIDYVASKKKPVIISTGMSNRTDLDLVIKIIKKYHNKFVILKCTSKYPANYKDLNLSSIKKIKEKYKCVVGFSDHTTDELSSIISITYGAKIIEKHFKLDNDISSVDSHFSMPISNYKILKKKLNSIEDCAGDENKIFDLSKTLMNNRRSLYICEDVKKNSKIDYKNVRAIRPGYGIHPKNHKLIIGKRFKKNFSKGTALKLKNIK